jgi:triosephosphate isomerase
MIFAGNWKLHLGPAGARDYLQVFLQRHRRTAGREVWFFPPAVSLEAVARTAADRPDIVVGAQNIYWEPKGAYTGETSIDMIREAGASAALVGHSERRHVFGETIEETGKKVQALLDADVTPVLCVGEKIEERESGRTHGVIEAQLDVLKTLDAETLERVVIAYEPVWAIGTGKNATPADAAQVHGHIRTWIGGRGAKSERTQILYGGSVKPANVAALVAEDEIDGVLVGGASVDPDSWSAITRTGLD